MVQSEEVLRRVNESDPSLLQSLLHIIEGQKDVRRRGRKKSLGD